MMMTLPLNAIVFILDADPERLAELVINLRGNERICVCNVQLVLDWNPAILIPQQFRTAAQSSKHRTAEGRETIKLYLKGQLPQPIEDDLLLHATFERLDEVRLYDSILRETRDLTSPVLFREALAPYRGIGTTTTLRRIASKLNGSDHSIHCAFIGAAGTLVPGTLVKQIQRDVTRMMIFVDRCLTEMEYTTAKAYFAKHKVANSLVILVLEIKYWTIGTPFPKEEAAFSAALEPGPELESFAAGYAAEFPDRKLDIEELCLHLGKSIVPMGVFGICVAAGGYLPAQRTVDELLRGLLKADGGGVHHRQYLTSLSLLEIFACCDFGGRGMDEMLGRYTFGREWVYILENVGPNHQHHRFTSPLWAFPVLACLEPPVCIEFDDAGFLKLANGTDTQQLTDLLQKALCDAISCGLQMKKWLVRVTQHRKTRKELDAHPFWIQMLSTNPQRLQVLKAVVASLTKQESMLMASAACDSSARRLKSVTGSIQQALSLMVDLLEPQQYRHKQNAWELAVEQANRMVEYANALKSDDVAIQRSKSRLLAMHKRANLLGLAIRLVRVVSNVELLNTWGKTV